MKLHNAKQGPRKREEKAAKKKAARESLVMRKPK
jgi:hypothetical protein